MSVETSHHVYQVLVARYLIFKRFLEVTRSARISEVEYKRRLWTLIQLHPTQILGKDYFNDLSTKLKTASMDYIQNQICDTDGFVTSDRGSRQRAIFVVLDEAQHVASQLKGTSVTQAADQVATPPILGYIILALRQPRGSRGLSSVDIHLDKTRIGGPGCEAVSGITQRNNSWWC